MADDNTALTNVFGMLPAATPDDVGQVFYEIENQIRLRMERLETYIWDIGAMLVSCECEWRRIVDATRLTVDFDQWAANVTGKSKRTYRDWMGQAAYFIAGDGTAIVEALGGIDEFRKNVTIGKARIAAVHHRAGREVDTDALADENVTEAQFAVIQNGDNSEKMYALCRDAKAGVVFLVAEGERPVVLLNYEEPDIPLARSILREVMATLRIFGMKEKRLPPPPSPPALAPETPVPVAEPS